MLLCQYLLIYNMLCIVRDYTYYIEITSIVYYLSIYLAMDIYVHADI